MTATLEGGRGPIVQPNPNAHGEIVLWQVGVFPSRQVCGCGRVYLRVLASCALLLVSPSVAVSVHHLRPDLARSDEALRRPNTTAGEAGEGCQALDGEIRQGLGGYG